jgi:predicted MFS family arabinose efflux permease
MWMEGSFGFKLAALGLVSIGIGAAELGGETLVGALVDRIGKVRSVASGLLGNCLACLALAGLTRLTLPGIKVYAVIGLLLFYLTYEFTVVSFLPLMSEVLPQARATMLAANIATLALGRAVGAWLAPHLFTWGSSTVLVNALAAVGFNVLALGALLFLRRVDSSEPSSLP